MFDKPGVYLIRNQINNKFYIGSSKNIRRRWEFHKYSFLNPPRSSRSILRLAVTKYGLENFKLEVLEECEPTREILLAREQHYIDTLHPEYNIQRTAGSSLGVKWSPERAAKCTPLLREYAALRRGKTFAEVFGEERAKAISELLAHKFKGERQQRITELARLANTGKERSDKTKKKISESNLVSEARKAFSESRRGIARSDELKKKVSDSHQTSEKVKAYHDGRVGKSRGNNPSGQSGIIWDAGRNKWQVRVRGKLYGRFANLDDAIIKRDAVVASGGLIATPPTDTTVSTSI